MRWMIWATAVAATACVNGGGQSSTGGSAGTGTGSGTDAAVTGGDSATQAGDAATGTSGETAAGGDAATADVQLVGDAAAADTGAGPDAVAATDNGTATADAKPSPVCGNGVCEPGENAQSCAKDCQATPGGHACDDLCGKKAPKGCYCDNQCAQYGDCCLPDGSMPAKGQPNKTCAGSTCADCNGSQPTGPVCGNGQCEKGETAANCPKDCTNTPPGACVTFDDVQAILQSKCSKCHSNYGGSCSGSKPAAGKISGAIGGFMPPKSQPQPTADEIAAVKAWAAGGALCSKADCPK